jgi:hypothetical protein
MLNGIPLPHLQPCRQRTAQPHVAQTASLRPLAPNPPSPLKFPPLQYQITSAQFPMLNGIPLPPLPPLPPSSTPLSSIGSRISSTCQTSRPLPPFPQLTHLPVSPLHPLRSPRQSQAARVLRSGPITAPFSIANDTCSIFNAQWNSSPSAPLGPEVLGCLGPAQTGLSALHGGQRVRLQAARLRRVVMRFWSSSVRTS